MPEALILHVVSGAALWQQWSWNPGTVIPLALAALLYIRGHRALQRARNRSGGRNRQSGLRGLAFVAGWLVLAISLVSPLHALSEQLFSAHMIQHELLMTLAAPLLVLARPNAVFAWALPMRMRRVWMAVRRPSTVQEVRRLLIQVRARAAWLAYALVLWGWHAPALFQWSLRDERVHALQHTCFFVVSLWFWQSTFGSRRTATAGASVLVLFATTIHTSILGALITFDTALWYPAYARTATALGVNPLHDQQLAGLIMWVPGSVPYLIAAVAIMTQWLGRTSSSQDHAPSPVRNIR
ncbi:MAG: cytochrome c oxidase assembly protein [Phycisphaerae bacterium]|nr:cytochrome c oxidase assembly protein [Gemmatimonadaceae bacterium]